MTIPSSSSLSPKAPASSALSVPCPLYVSANEPYNPKDICAISPFTISLALLESLAAPAVCELDGPIITGPNTSNMLISIKHFLQHKYNAVSLYYCEFLKCKVYKKGVSKSEFTF